TNYEVYRWLLPIYIVSGIITAVNISATLLEKGKVRVIGLLAQASFFIYVSHGVQILGRLSQVINKVIPSENQFVLVFKYLATPILCVSICVFIYWLMRKFTPKILEILTGSR
ncbi:MAG: hypothetical protein LBS43_02405, partial [Prevotellaceae bacterium]|nr:hypothetical protein [Prevotellaceae bacterium]